MDSLQQNSDPSDNPAQSVAAMDGDSDGNVSEEMAAAILLFSVLG